MHVDNKATAEWALSPWEWLLFLLYLSGVLCIIYICSYVRKMSQKHYERFCEFFAVKRRCIARNNWLDSSTCSGGRFEISVGLGWFRLPLLDWFLAQEEPVVKPWLSSDVMWSSFHLVATKLQSDWNLKAFKPFILVTSCHFLSFRKLCSGLAIKWIKLCRTGSCLLPPTPSAHF